MQLILQITQKKKTRCEGCHIFTPLQNLMSSQSKHCNSKHNALHIANMPGSKCFAINGVGVTVCAWHLMFRMQGIVDLLLGEQYMLCTVYCIFL